MVVSRGSDIEAIDLAMKLTGRSARYKSLADIERGFRVLKSELDIVPMSHRLPDRIRSHALICFVALIMHRVLRRRLKDKKI